MKKQSKKAEAPVEITAEELHEMQAEQAHEAALALDALLCEMQIPTHVAVNAVCSVMTQAMGQMYASAYSADIHDDVVGLAEKGIFRIVRDVQQLINDKGLVPKIQMN